MEVVICYCLKCKSELGRFMNAWYGIGNTYFTPIYNFVSGTGLETTGDVYEAANGSSIQHSLLRDVVCAGCRVVLGLRCDSAPDDHILKENQLILRLKETSIISEGSGKVANLSILKVIPLKDDKNTNSSTVPHTPSLLPSRRSSVSHATLSNNKISNVNGEVSEEHNSKKLRELTLPKQTDSESEITSLIIGVEKFRGWAEDIILSQQKDIDRLSGTMLRIERDMQTLKSYMQDLNNKFASDYQCKEIAEVRNEIKRVNEKLDQKEETPEWNKAASLLARNMKTIAGDFKKLSIQVERFYGFENSLKDLASRLDFLEVQDRSMAHEKIPSFDREKSGESVSRKRNRGLVEKSTLKKKKTFDLAQVKVKKQRSDELHTKDSLEFDHQVKRSDVVDLVSPEPDPQCFDKKEERYRTQDNFCAIGKGISHQTPQVLIRASNTTKMLLQVPKKGSGLPLEARKSAGPDSSLLQANEVKEDEKRKCKSDSNIQDSIPRLCLTSSDGNGKKNDIVDSNHDPKIDGRSLRARKVKK
ncbi:hypothetical protein OnM2_064052 [Erysiphe neolycopersici]|uniref:Mis18 domain-containing protein n=1 Tax=Erysiphe neolycopersici TaxID=212602 RepID=A0A420HN91_9PEZI|nr:hypothetical protein OnM2_064052 [Erysiphe neolycopersici]